MSDVLLGLFLLVAGAGMTVAATRSWTPPSGTRRQAARRPAAFYERAPLAYCPAEGRQTPHALDAGQRRRCLVCKATTKEGNDG
ncbi:hypothetical protein [Streptomyces sioyaensis]|uniref:hypothetical protein n=1 Tax=Streptomyces sioyaensis TaxID=67364 RepID=UPI003D750EED